MQVPQEEDVRAAILRHEGIEDKEVCLVTLLSSTANEGAELLLRPFISSALDLLCGFFPPSGFVHVCSAPKA